MTMAPEVAEAIRALIANQQRLYHALTFGDIPSKPRVEYILSQLPEANIAPVVQYLLALLPPTAEPPLPATNFMPVLTPPPRDKSIISRSLPTNDELYKPDPFGGKDPF